MMHKLIDKLVTLVVVLSLAAAAPLVLAQDDDDKKPPPTKRTQTLSQKVFKQLEEAQQAYDEKNYQKALSIMDGVKANQDKLNNFEKATLYNFYAAIYYGMDRPEDAVNAYKEVLRTPDLPEGMRNNALFALAQLTFVQEDYRQAIKILNRWFTLVDSPKPGAYVLLAQGHYQLGEYAAAEKPLLDALREASRRGQEPRENWLALLRAVYYELENYDRAAKVLEVLVSKYPKPSYYMQLSGMYGLMGRQEDQLAVMHAAYTAGMLERQSDLLNMARLYMAEGAPYPAVELLKKGFEEDKIEEDVDTLQLYAQALSFAQEYEAQLPVLKKLASESGEARHYNYLGQANMSLGNWDEAAEAYRKALDAKGQDRLGKAYMLYGTALYNADQLKAARKAFVTATQFVEDEDEEQAANWVKFMDNEIKRKEALSQY